MIAIYAQATDRQGLDSAINGAAVDSSHSGFKDLRAKAQIAANGTRVVAGPVDVRYSRGITRLVFDDAGGDQDTSPITAVVEMKSANVNLDDAAAVIVSGVRAIHREVELDSVRAALQAASHIHDSLETRHKLIITASIVVLAGVVILTALLFAEATS